MQDIPFFFIIGRPRSGTTMLRLLFEAHPNIIVPPESPFIIVLYKKYGKITNWTSDVITEFVDDLFEVTYFDKWLFDKGALLNELLESKGKSTFQEMVLRIYANYHSLYNKGEIKLIGDKNPLYSLYPHRIHQLFPEARIIHITRDYRDNYLSLTNVNFEIPVVPIVVYRWKYALKKMWHLKKRNPDLIYSLKYEDLVADPELHCRRMYDFLGIEFDPSVLTFYEKKQETEDAYSSDKTIKIVHKSLFNPINTGRMEKWKTEMTARQIKVADHVVGKTAEKAGYQRMYPRINPFLYLWISPSLIYASIMYRLIMIADHLPHGMRNALNKSLGICLKIYWKFNKKKLKPL
jgi:hypothetical protein